MSRTLNVVRMQLINRQTFVWVPLLVLGGSLILSLVIFALWIPVVTAPKYGGGAQATLVVLPGRRRAGDVTLTFPFSQAMSVTRREFYLGTLADRGAGLRHPGGRSSSSAGSSSRPRTAGG